jgi:hypothetical protein
MNAKTRVRRSAQQIVDQQLLGQATAADYLDAAEAVSDVKGLAAALAAALCRKQALNCTPVQDFEPATLPELTGGDQ